MKRGDTVTIRKMDDPEWYFCQIGDRKGFIAAAFLESASAQLAPAPCPLPPAEERKKSYNDLLGAGAITQDTFDSLVMRVDQFAMMFNEKLMTQQEFDTSLAHLDKEQEDSLKDLAKQKAMAKAIEVFNTKGAKKGTIYFQE